MARWMLTGAVVVGAGALLYAQWAGRTRGGACTTCQVRYFTPEEVERMESQERRSEASSPGGRITKSDAEWRACLTDEQFCITRQHGTERAFQNKYWDYKVPGVYACVCCGQELFSSEAKYDSGTGWPSFFRPVSPAAVGTSVDDSLGVRRTEVHCSRCEAHLGHVFEDGPPPTGLRFCMNSAALVHRPKDAAEAP